MMIVNLLWFGCLAGCVISAPEMIAQALVAEREFQDDVGPGPLLLLLVSLLVIFAMIGVGVVVALAALAVAALLAAFGIISASTAFGFLRGSAASGVRAFFLLGAGAAGLVAGTGMAWLTYRLWEPPWHEAVAIATGGTLGMAAGVIAAALFNYTWGRVIAWSIQ